ncbi:hypothetical protein D0T12_01335 [Actinomadura spongiicola]|uniref:Uncharacterized protein n=1 Tax=Actinomadura spongiicola TaxID=2303421 RepID=A0A372GNG1_9ACTN|nr:hypothetical protein D0T12_01335 [Actinomadura spongiicola]
MYRLDTSPRYVVRPALASGDLFVRPSGGSPCGYAGVGRPSDRSWSPSTRSRSADACRVAGVYGDEPDRRAGRGEATAELAWSDRKNGEFRVYVTEVCQSCAWKHLAKSYVLGCGVQDPER